MGEVSIGEESYSKKETDNLKEIIVGHIKRLAVLACTEFVAGYWEKKPVRVGNGFMMSEVYHPDVRESFINGVDFLVTLIRPFSRIDSNKTDAKYFLSKLEEFETEQKERFEQSKDDLNKDDWVAIKTSYRKKIFEECLNFLTDIKYFGEAQMDFMDIASHDDPWHKKRAEEN